MFHTNGAMSDMHKQLGSLTHQQVRLMLQLQYIHMITAPADGKDAYGVLGHSTYNTHSSAPFCVLDCLITLERATSLLQNVMFRYMLHSASSHSVLFDIYL